MFDRREFIAAATAVGATAVASAATPRQKARVDRSRV
jgi:hypothetical protein